MTKSKIAAVTSLSVEAWNGNKFSMTAEERQYLEHLLPMAVSEFDLSREDLTELRTSLVYFYSTRMGNYLRICPTMENYVDRKALKRRLQNGVIVTSLDVMVVPSSDGKTLEKSRFFTRSGNGFTIVAGVSLGDDLLEVYVALGMARRNAVFDSGEAAVEYFCFDGTKKKDEDAKEPQQQPSSSATAEPKEAEVEYDDEAVFLEETGPRSPCGKRSDQSPEPSEGKRFKSSSE
jgi:hypothetical protein